MYVSTHHQPTAGRVYTLPFIYYSRLDIARILSLAHEPLSLLV